VLGRAGSTGDQPDGVGPERQWTFTGCREQPFGGQQPLELFEPGEQFTDADLADIRGPQAERASFDPEVWTGSQDYSSPLGDVGGVEKMPRARHRHRDVGVGIAEGQELGRHVGPPGQLSDLPFHPDLAQPVDPRTDRGGDHAQR
jgi:hypothetical protein